MQTASTSNDGRYTTDLTYFNNNTSISQLGFTPAADVGLIWQMFILFPNVTIPQGATINSATLSLFTGNAEADVAGNLNARVYAEDADNPTAPDSAADAMGRTRTTAFAAWQLDGWADDTTVQVTGLASVVQEIVNRPGWVSGNGILLLLDDNGSLRDIWLSQHESTDPNPQLDINYTA